MCTLTLLLLLVLWLCTKVYCCEVQKNAFTFEYRIIRTHTQKINKFKKKERRQTVSNEKYDD